MENIVFLYSLESLASHDNLVSNVIETSMCLFVGYSTRNVYNFDKMIWV